MSKTRFLLLGLLRLVIAFACVAGAMAAYKLLVHPLLEHALSLGKNASSTVRRVCIFLVMVGAYAAYVRFYERRAPRELAPRWRWILVAAVAGVASIGVTILSLYATGHYQLVGSRGIGLAGDVLGMLWIAAVLEEIVFRAILFRILEERIGTNAALIGSALVFSAAHLGNNGVNAITVLVVALAGLMWALVFMLSRNVWVAAAHHFCWNSTIFLVGLPLSGDADVRAHAPLETVYRGSMLWTGGAFGPEDSLLNIAVCSAICYTLWRIARRRGEISAARVPARIELEPERDVVT